MRGFFKSPLFVSLAASLVCAALMLTEAIDHVYWVQRYKLAQQSAPADMVIVSLDRTAGTGGERIVGSTARQAQLVSRILEQKPQHLYIDIPLAEGADAAGDAAFARAVAESGDRLTLVMRGTVDLAQDNISFGQSASRLIGKAAIAVSAWEADFLGYAQFASVAPVVDGRPYPALAAKLAGQSADKSASRIIVPDFSIDPSSIAVMDAGEILTGKHDRSGLVGKTVLVTTTAPGMGNLVGYYGHGRVSAAVADISGAISMRRGTAHIAGKWPFLVLFLVLVLLGHRARSLRLKVAAYGSLVALVALLPAALMEHGIVTGSSWAILAMLIYVPGRIWQRWRRTAELTNGRSGLPNIDALAAHGVPDGFDIVAASISQYDQMLASLPRELHGECARQIARRLSVASGDSKVYVTDNGQFVWLEEPRPLESQVCHLEGLKALFSAPLVIGGHLLDTNIHFGLDRLSEGPPARRIQAALASANEAQAKGKLYEQFEQSHMAEAPWQLSLHARIDEGLRNGDIWLALQGQFDLRSGRISGAEALIRWNDPERGPIPPDAFILQAERAGRIEAITYWVLERAMEASVAMNARWSPFQISVNLSARMADHPDLLARVADIVARHRFDCSRITFEVTETFSFTNRDLARSNLLGLRAMGFRLSIDDFGTGQASLAYLAEIPSDEIKLDKRFIQAITSDKRERVIVRTVIKLAHALGQEIVAEGVENKQTLDALRRMNCDLAQGYLISRPVRLEDLIAEIESGSGVRAAQG